MDIDLTQLDESQLVELNRQIVARLKYLQEARTPAGGQCGAAGRSPICTPTFS